MKPERAPKQYANLWERGSTGVFAVVEKQDGEESIHFILKDHIGSWTTITDAEGNVEQELSFDAWGNRRDPNTWQNYSVVEPVEAPMFDRGYTGHEHLNGFGLINMNGRMYDPVMSSFLSVDRYVQQPENSQGFNRYAYCMYNPLKYVDPSGWMMSRPSGSGGIPPQFKAPQPVAVDGGYQLIEIDGVLYGGCLIDTYAIDNAISSPGNTPSEEKPYFSSDRGFGDCDQERDTPSFNPTINHGGGGSSAGMFGNNKSTGINICIQSFELGNGIKTQIIDAAVRYNYKTGRTWHQWEFKLTARQQNWRLVNTLGEGGAKYLKFSKGLGIAGASISVGITTIQTVDYAIEGGRDPNVFVKSTLDVIMVGVGFLGPIGFGISAAYFITDVATRGFGGWGSIPENYKEKKP
jgi:RHS repeat-associated protein